MDIENSQSINYQTIKIKMTMQTLGEIRELLGKA